MDTVKRKETIILESAFDKKIEKPELKFNPGLALTGVRTTGPRFGKAAEIEPRKERTQTHAHIL